MRNPQSTLQQAASGPWTSSLSMKLSKNIYMSTWILMSNEALTGKEGISVGFPYWGWGWRVRKAGAERKGWCWEANAQTQKAKGFFSFLFLKFILFIYFGLHWVFVAARGLSPVAARGGYSALQCVGFSLRWLLLLHSTGSRCAGFSSCVTRAQ